MGKTLVATTGKEPPVVLDNHAGVYGSYVHGLFDEGKLAANLVKQLAKAKGVLLENEEIEDYRSFKEKQYDKLADVLRTFLSMEEIYGMLKEAHWQCGNVGMAEQPEGRGT